MGFFIQLFPISKDIEFILTQQASIQGENLKYDEGNIIPLDRIESIHNGRMFIHNA